MYLLIPVSLPVKLAIISYLHSIMYLLIRGEPGKMTKKEINLHSIMYLLIHKRGQKSPFSFKFTFHNVSINSHLRRQTNILMYLIYIP